MKIEDKQNKKRRSIASERNLAAKLGGKVQPLSGALPVAKFKGDVTTEHFVIDDKTTQAGSFSVSQALMTKLRTDAFRQKQKRGVLCIHFEQTGNRYYVLSERDFLEYNQSLQ